MLTKPTKLVFKSVNLIGTLKKYRKNNLHSPL